MSWLGPRVQSHCHWRVYVNAHKFIAITFDNWKLSIQRHEKQEDIDVGSGDKDDDNVVVVDVFSPMSSQVSLSLAFSLSVLERTPTAYTIHFSLSVTFLLVFCLNFSSHEFNCLSYFLCVSSYYILFSLNLLPAPARAPHSHTHTDMNGVVFLILKTFLVYICRYSFHTSHVATTSIHISQAPSQSVFES